jgi:hypothetical protein
MLSWSATENSKGTTDQANVWLEVAVPSVRVKVTR